MPPSDVRPRASRRRLSAADRRAAILDAALDVFSARGFHRASLDDVAARGGISKALIYEHFTSKHELQLALLETYVHDALDRVAAAAGAAAPVEQRLRAAVDAFLSFVEERPAAWRLISRNAADPDTAAALAGLQDQAATATAALLAPYLAAVDTDDADPGQVADMLARQLSGAVQALATWWAEHSDVPRARAVELAMDFAWVGLDRVSRGERWAQRGRPDVAA